MSKITADHLSHAACVYIRQSSPGQLQNNHESRRRQYALGDQAKARAFAEVIIIDEPRSRSCWFETTPCPNSPRSSKTPGTSAGRR
jgi:hypothetical protein